MTELHDRPHPEFIANAYVDCTLIYFMSINKEKDINDRIA